MHSFGSLHATKDDDDTDDEESDSEVDLAFEEYTVSESESDNEWIYSLHWKMIVLIPEWLSNTVISLCFNDSYFKLWVK